MEHESIGSKYYTSIVLLPRVGDEPLDTEVNRSRNTEPAKKTEKTSQTMYVFDRYFASNRLETHSVERLSILEAASVKYTTWTRIRKDGSILDGKATLFRTGFNDEHTQSLHEAVLGGRTFRP